MDADIVMMLKGTGERPSSSGLFHYIPCTIAQGDFQGAHITVELVCLLQSQAGSQTETFLLRKLKRQTLNSRPQV